MRSYWRDRCRPIIAEILAKKLDPKDQKKELTAAYPFGVRARWPYKIWLDEIKRQTGKKSNLYKSKNKEIHNPDQLSIFDS